MLMSILLFTINKNILFPSTNVAYKKIRNSNTIFIRSPMIYYMETSYCDNEQHICNATLEGLLHVKGREA